MKCRDTPCGYPALAGALLITPIYRVRRYIAHTANSSAFLGDVTLTWINNVKSIQGYHNRFYQATHRRASVSLAPRLCSLAGDDENAIGRR